MVQEKIESNNDNSKIKKIADAVKAKEKMTTQPKIEPKKSTVKPTKHTVVEGDSLSSIAAQYHLSVDDVKTWNHLKSVGGLTAAACLSSLGYKVLVLEQHYTAGGFTHSYSRNGYEWDVGVHYIGDVGVKTTLARRLFDFISNDQLKWQALDPCYDRIHLGDDHFDLVAAG